MRVLACFTATVALCLGGLSTTASAGPRTCTKDPADGWQSVTDPKRVSASEIEFNDSVKGIQQALVAKISLFCLNGTVAPLGPRKPWTGATCDLRMVELKKKGRVVGKLLCTKGKGPIKRGPGKLLKKKEKKEKKAKKGG